MRARLFVRYFVGSAFMLLVGVFLFIAIIDPNNTLVLSPPLDRYPAATNQRFSYTSIARSPEFDSIIIGTSTTRMIEPVHINKRLGVKLANLSMNSATWWEQGQILKLFLRHHKQPKLIIWGIDTTWCVFKKTGPRLSSRVFPYWLYDENKWNDYLHILNFTTITRVGKQLGTLVGLREPKFGKDGYHTLNDKGEPYNLDKARRKIYGVTTPIPPARALKFPIVDVITRLDWSFPAHAILEKQVSLINKNSRVILMMVPYHQHSQGPPNGTNMLRYNECKKRLFKIAGKMKNVDFIDFMYRSPFTSEDRNYWDHMHYNERGAKQIEDGLVDYIANNVKASEIYRTFLKKLSIF